MGILHPIPFGSRLFACREVSPSFLTVDTVVHANVDGLPVKACSDGQKNTVDSRRSRGFPRAFDQFGVGAEYLRVVLPGTEKHAEENEAHQTEQH